MFCPFRRLCFGRNDASFSAGFVPHYLSALAMFFFLFLFLCFGRVPCISRRRLLGPGKYVCCINHRVYSIQKDPGRVPSGFTGFCLDECPSTVVLAKCYMMLHDIHKYTSHLPSRSATLTICQAVKLSQTCKHAAVNPPDGSRLDAIEDILPNKSPS